VHYKSIQLVALVPVLAVLAGPLIAASSPEKTLVAIADALEAKDTKAALK
jgi:hypothetical protein